MGLTVNAGLEKNFKKDGQKSKDGKHRTRKRRTKSQV